MECRLVSNMCIALYPYVRLHCTSSMYLCTYVHLLLISIHMYISYVSLYISYVSLYICTSHMYLYTSPLYICTSRMSVISSTSPLLLYYTFESFQCLIDSISRPRSRLFISSTSDYRFEQIGLSMLDCSFYTSVLCLSIIYLNFLKSTKKHLTTTTTTKTTYFFNWIKIKLFCVFCLCIVNSNISDNRQIKISSFGRREQLAVFLLQLGRLDYLPSKMPT